MALTKRRMSLGDKSVDQVIITVLDQFLPITLLSDIAVYCFQEMGKVYIILKDKLFPNGKFDWRHAKDEFFKWYFAYYQEETVDFNKRPELHGLMTEWMSADELVKHVKLGDLLEFKGTTYTTMFHHWSVCVRVNTEIEACRRTPNNVRMLHLSRVGSKSITSGDLFNFGIVFVSAKIHIKTLADTHMTRQCRINNSLDSKWKPFDGKDIAKFALTFRGSARYNGTLWNCEHFVKCCRYGHGESLQTEMISTLVALYLIAAAFLSLVQLPVWLSSYWIFMFATWYYFGLQLWRALEHVAFVFMREHQIPISIFNIPACFSRMTYLEMYYVFCGWLVSVAIRLYFIIFVLEFWEVDLFPNFKMQ